jgi:hypothetical protein
MSMERRPAPCCGIHSYWWAICTCGWEKDCGFNDKGEVTTAFTLHRLTVLEAAVGVRVAFK